jgi:hypothetical protein
MDATAVPAAFAKAFTRSVLIKTSLQNYPAAAVWDDYN